MFRVMSDRIPAEFRPGPVRVPNPPADALPNSSSSNSVPLGASAVPRGFPASSGPQTSSERVPITFRTAPAGVPTEVRTNPHLPPSEFCAGSAQVPIEFLQSLLSPPASAVLAVPAKFRVSFRAPGDVLVQFRAGFGPPGKLGRVVVRPGAGAVGPGRAGEPHCGGGRSERCPREPRAPGDFRASSG